MYTVYKITNTINEKYYIGVHKTLNPNDSYMGSGRAIVNAIKKYGKENFKKEILFKFENKNDAYNKEKEILLELWNKSETYNMNGGGMGSWEHINISNRINPMHNPNVVKKMIETSRKNGSYYTEKKLAQLKQITKLAAESNRGKEHSQEWKQKQSDGLKKWAKERNNEKFKQALRKSRLLYTIKSPDGIIYTPDSIKEWCMENNYPLSSITTNEAGYTIKRGKLKGWKILKKERR